MPPRICEYFESQAPSYQQRSAGWLWAWLRAREEGCVRRSMGSADGLTALDLGCGAGFYARSLVEAGAREVVAVDMVAAMVEQIRHPQISTRVGDAATVDLGRRFPLIVCAGLLEFVADPLSVLRNAARHAEPDGRLVLLVPRKGWLGNRYRAFHAGHGISVHLYSAADIARLGEDSGWRVEHSVKLWPFSLVLSLRRVAP